MQIVLGIQKVASALRLQNAEERQDDMEFLEVPIFDDDIFKLLFRFLWDLTFLTLCVALSIYRSEKKREFVFTAVVMNIMVFFICFTLKKFELELGMALGLFAIFGVLRYRTTTLTSKEMSYLFVVIGLAVINALSNKKTSYAELLAVNLVILLVTIVMESFDSGSRTLQFTMNYNRVELLRSENRNALMADVAERTGLKIQRVAIKTLNLQKKNATIVVTYADQGKKARPAKDLPIADEQLVATEAISSEADNPGSSE